MVKLPTEKQRRIVKSKIQGKKQRDIGKVEYPKASQASQDVLVSRELSKPHVAKYMDKELSVLLEQNNVTKSQYIMNIGQAMQADKQNQFTGEIIPDHAMRLSANKQAREFLDISDKDSNVYPDISKAMTDNVDEIELQRLIFKKS